MREEREEEKKPDGTHKTLGGSEERRGLHIQGRPSLGGALLRQKGRLCGKRTQQPACRRVRNVRRVLIPALPTQPERVSSNVDKGCVLERGVWRANSGRGQQLAMRIQPEGTGGRGGALQGSLNQQRTRAALLSDTQREEPPCSLSAPVPVPASPGTRNGSHLGG